MTQIRDRICQANLKNCLSRGTKSCKRTGESSLLDIDIKSVGNLKPMLMLYHQSSAILRLLAEQTFRLVSKWAEQTSKTWDFQTGRFGRTEKPKGPPKAQNSARGRAEKIGGKLAFIVEVEARKASWKSGGRFN